MQKVGEDMKTTRLSTTGRITLPKRIRESHSWTPGTEFAVEELRKGFSFGRLHVSHEHGLEDVAGCLGHKGKPKTRAQMKAGVRREVKRRHDRGRH
jgi:bifunctional DNA-binding transcriptional regulator/antitoxin component of YhaV-PrlF toxin-antitoxin module